MPLLAYLKFPDVDPVIFRIGRVAVHWYGVAYLLGFIFAYFLLKHIARRGWLRTRPELVGDFVTWVAFGVFIGGRAGWWFFYHRAAGPEPWYEPFAIWNGGMSFHGGLIGVAVAMYLWAKVHKLSMANLADASALVAPIGLFFGRIANFINHELFGRPTHVPWGMIFPAKGSQYPDFVYEPFARHPSQLYEAILEGPILLAILWLVFLKRRPRDGGMALLFVIVYSIFRFGVEFTREPDEQLGYIAFGWLTMGQILSMAIAVTGIVIWLVYIHRAPAAMPAPLPRDRRNPARNVPRHK
jgi:phosphatidylglycerol:prolipoprotein diacylglycerol transferase